MTQSITGVKETTPQPSITFRIFKAAAIIAKGNVVRMQNSGDSALGGYSASYYGMAACCAGADTIPVGVAMEAVSAAKAAAGAYFKVQTGGLGQQALVATATSTNTAVGAYLYAIAAGAVTDIAVASAAARSAACAVGYVLIASTTTDQAAGSYIVAPSGSW